MALTRMTRVGLVVLLFALYAVAGKKNAPQPQSASINMTVLRDANGKPVKNAEVVLHLLKKNGQEMQEGLELKTHEDGKAEATGIPYGKVRLQVIAPGFKTYGEDIDVNQPNMEITIKLQKPSQQYSIYK
ncbi:MAG: carboxypeptidase-like regulatory domain-containing protein [Candidatus Angelobacter sp.]